MAAFTNVENKRIKFPLKQPGVQGAIQFPKNYGSVQQYLGEFGYVRAWHYWTSINKSFFKKDVIVV